MKVYHQEFYVRSSEKRQILDVTENVEEVVRRSKIKNGLCLIFLPHATAALLLEENETGLIDDIDKFLEKLFPRTVNYKHNRIDDNAEAHLASGFIGQSRIYPIKDGEIVRGTWQHTLLIEMDGPRQRTVFITVIGD